MRGSLLDAHAYEIPGADAGRDLAPIVGCDRHALMRQTLQSLLQGGASVISQAITIRFCIQKKKYDNFVFVSPPQLGVLFLYL